MKNTSNAMHIDFLKKMSNNFYKFIKNTIYKSKQEEINSIHSNVKLNNVYNFFSKSLRYNNFNDFERNSKYNDSSKLNLFEIYNDESKQDLRYQFEEKLLFSMCDFIKTKDNSIPHHFVICTFKAAIHYMCYNSQLTKSSIFRKPDSKYKKSSFIQKEYDISIPKMKSILINEGVLNKDNFPQEISILNGYCDIKSYQEGEYITYQFLWDYNYINSLFNKKGINKLSDIEKLGKTKNIHQIQNSLEKLAQYLSNILNKDIYEIFDDEFNDGFYVFDVLQLPKLERERNIAKIFDKNINKALKIDKIMTREIEKVLHILIKKIKDY